MKKPDLYPASKKGFRILLYINLVQTFLQQQIFAKNKTYGTLGMAYL
jgi:hypothetical protein